MKRIVILGSTGSIGENALRIVDSLPGEFKVVGLAAHRATARILEQARAFHVPTIAISDPAAAAAAHADAPPGIEVLSGIEGAAELAARPDVDLVVCAIVGMAALRPALAAIEAGHDLAIATKEVLVACGAIVRRLCEERHVNLLPIDSEHSALFQSLQDTRLLPWCVRNRTTLDSGLRTSDSTAIEPTIRRLVLTASGGPFGMLPSVDFDSVTPDLALNHPRWKMGPKVTIDSATMMNKGLEIMEARWLFDIPVDRIDVLVHPQSIVHSLVEFRDGAVMAQLGATDMRIAIQYALCWPRRLPNPTLPRLDLATVGSLDFREPDPDRFPCLRIARAALSAGGSAPAVMNAANEVAVAAFLDRKIPFPGIWRTVDGVLSRPDLPAAADTLDDILSADTWARRAASELVQQFSFWLSGALLNDR